MNWVSDDFGFDQGHDTAVDTPRNGGMRSIGTARAY